MVERARRRIPEATVARLPVYLRILYRAGQRHVQNISSERLAELAGVNAAKVRKDLSYLGSYGTRGVGYEVEYLCTRSAASWASPTTGPSSSSAPATSARRSPATAVSASAASPWPASSTSTRPRSASVLGGVRVRHIDELPQIVQAKRVRIGVVATPPAAAQDAADRLVAAGITSILNFAPVVLNVPRAIEVRKVDLAVELQILSYYEQRRAGGALHAVAGGSRATGSHRTASA